MITLQRGSWPRLYADVVRRAAEEGYTRPSRDGDTIDLGPALLACPAPIFGKISGRGGSTEFARLEQLGYLAGVDSEHMLRTAPGYVKYKDRELGWWGAYGPRLKSRLVDVVRELDHRPFSRRAVALIWTGNDMEVAVDLSPLDVPCTLGLAYWVGPAGELRSQAFMRSTDLWLGLYYDMPAFAFLQKAVAKALRRSAGLTFLTTSSLHMYQRNAELARKVKGVYVNEDELVHQILPDPQVGRARAADRWEWLVNWANTEIKLTMNKEMGHAIITGR